MSRLNLAPLVIIGATAMALLMPVALSSAADAPVKVFILAGQSNMVGDGRLDPAETKGTLAYMVQKSDKQNQFKHLVDEDGNWVECDDVWFFQRQAVRTGRGKSQTIETVDVAGRLKPGLQGSGDKLKIGPELQFGHVMGDHFGNQVLIIKTAWGGKSLAIDFRPPRAGDPPFELKANKNGVKPEVGKYYRLMLADVRHVLDNLPKYFPEYDGQGYEIVGLGWHQGWNDGCNPLYADEYQKNLSRLIEDVRNDLGVEDLPVVIASSGFGGHQPNLPGVRARIQRVVEPAQISVASRMDHVTCVETRDFFRARDQSPSGASYHWNSNAETYFLIGDGMGRAMIELLKK